MHTVFHWHSPSMTPMLRVLLLVSALTAASPAFAQGEPADSLCTYDTCALRVESGLFSTRLVRGVEGVPVSGLGLFRSSLSEVVGGSERALEHARVYDRTRTPAALTALGAGLLLGLGLATAQDDQVSDGVSLGMTLGGLGLTVVSIQLGTRSQRAFSRALWWYNRDLPREP